MKSFLAGISPDFIGLTGDPRTVSAIAAQFPAVFFKGLPDKPGEGYRVEHTSQIYAVDRDGRLRAEMANANLADMATVTRGLLAENP
jgi:cytochrome oxidase Cu insertion factor (SCO1/SenC/PrrC family)